MDWTELENLGWERNVSEVNGVKKVFFRTPPENGIRRKITRARDLKKTEKNYASILFPKANFAREEEPVNVVQETPASSIFNILDTNIHCTSNTIEDKCEGKRMKLEHSASNLVVTNRIDNSDLSDEIPKYVSRLTELIKSSRYEKKDIGTITADVILALNEESNPFREFPWNVNKNIFCEILDFGLSHTPFLIRMITDLSNTDHGLTEKHVYRVAFIYSLLVCSVNPQKNSAFFKLITLMLKTSGCTGKTIHYLSTTK